MNTTCLKCIYRKSESLTPELREQLAEMHKALGEKIYRPPMSIWHCELSGKEVQIFTPACEHYEDDRHEAKLKRFKKPEIKSNENKFMTENHRKQIIEAIAVARENFEGSDAQFAASLEINNTAYSRMKKGETERVIADKQLIRIARKLDVPLGNNKPWNTANTPVFQFITKQLEICQQHGISSLLCDFSDIGKTHAAKHYVRTHKNAVYIDCSQSKTKRLLIRSIAKELGINHTGRYADVYGDLVFYLRTLQDALIVMDEYGDLNYEAILETKALWNGAPNCAFYVMGADGLEKKMRLGQDNKKVGYAELFSRFGKKYGKVIPAGKDNSTKTLRENALMIIKANAPEGTDPNKILRGTMGDDERPSLRRIRNELTKA